jgi:hypothetical protein
MCYVGAGKKSNALRSCSVTRTPRRSPQEIERSTILFGEPHASGVTVTYMAATTCLLDICNELRLKYNV